MKRLIITAIILLSMAAVSCNNDEGPQESALDGIWIASGCRIAISGSEGRFYEITSGLWFSALREGHIKLNDVMLKNITPSGERTWNCSIRGVYSEDGVATGTFWADDSRAELSEDGNSLVVTAIIPVEEGSEEMQEAKGYFVRSEIQEY